MSNRRQPFTLFNAGLDSSRMFYAKTVGHDTAAGVELTTATLQAVSASNYIEFLLNTVGDSGINDYTGAGGAAGRILISDSNANSIEEVINIINGIGVGQPGTNRRWRAALADVHPKYALTTSDLLNQGSTVSTLLGVEHIGTSVYLDSSALADADEVWLGIGTEGGTRPGSGMIVPDYFEDFPGESGVSGNASNVPDRTRQKAKRNDDGVVAIRKRVVITAIGVNLLHATTKTVAVFPSGAASLSGTQIYEESFGAAVVSTVFNGQRGAELKGPWGESLHIRVRGTGGSTAGSIWAAGYYEQAVDA